MSVAVFVLLVSLAGVAYAYLGYPLAIAARARLAPRPLHREPAALPTVSIVVIAHDAMPALAAKLANLDALDYPPELLEFVVASDGSRDGTAQLLRDAREPRLKALVFPARRGKSACLADAIAAATGEIIVFTDVRQQLEHGALRALAAALADPDVGCASGELRFRERAATGRPGYAASVGAYWRYEKWLRRNESRSGSVVGVTGAIYAARRALLPAVPPGIVLDDVYVPMAIAMRGARVVFEPGAVAWDEPSADAASEARRKRRTLAGNYQLVAAMPALLDPRRNPLWLRFVSHKLMRLAAPWLLLAAFVANLALFDQAPGWAALFVLQAAGYALALAGVLSARLRTLLPVRLAATFLEMNAYAALALFDWLSGRDLHLWRGAAPAREATR
ncbi:MAG TPA: glycosyltransferase [Xanthomonadales bacterium]|nr:glycosyltransferase [Xanthomonadales bacterium]